MNVINATFLKWHEVEASILENYKRKYEGLGRTAGSYILTNVKSAATLEEADPKMATVKNCINLLPFAGVAVVVGSITYVITKKHYNKKVVEEIKDEKEN